MRTIRIKVYKFDELSEQAKQKAISNYHDVNTDHNWWDFIYEDAKENSGIQITGFDLDRGRYIEGKFIEGAHESAWLVTTNHGEDTSTYKVAKYFIEEYGEIVQRHSDWVHIDKVAEGNEYEFDIEADECEKSYLDSILAEYVTILHKQYEYLQSDEAISKAITANEYEFTFEGERFY